MLSEVVAALSTALDITEGQPEGHAARTCMIAMRLAEVIELPASDRSALFYAAQLKDLGCSSNAARVAMLFDADDQRVKHDFKTTDWQNRLRSAGYILRNVAPSGRWTQKAARFAAIALGGQRAARRMVQIRCERGATIARHFELPDSAARAIHELDEHWNGKGHPHGLRGEEISALARLVSLAQTLDVFIHAIGLEGAFNMAHRRKGRWFDPELVKALLAIRNDRAFWQRVTDGSALDQVRHHEPADRVVIAGNDRLDRIAEGFAQVVDAKSPSTRKHSEHVTQLAMGIGKVQGWSDDRLRRLRHAALLHDIGKLGVSNAILDKPGKLTDDERFAMQRHPHYTHRILHRIRSFETLADIAASHHERLDGHGYHRGLHAKQLGPEARCLVVADMFEAISAERPYRDTIPIDKVFEILDRDVGSAICPQAYHALKYHVETIGYTPSRFSENA